MGVQSDYRAHYRYSWPPYGSKIKPLIHTCHGIPESCGEAAGCYWGNTCCLGCTGHERLQVKGNLSGEKILSQSRWPWRCHGFWQKNKQKKNNSKGKKIFSGMQGTFPYILTEELQMTKVCRWDASLFQIWVNSVTPQFIMITFWFLFSRRFDVASQASFSGAAHPSAFESLLNALLSCLVNDKQTELACRSCNNISSSSMAVFLSPQYQVVSNYWVPHKKLTLCPFQWGSPFPHKGTTIASNYHSPRQK